MFLLLTTSTSNTLHCQTEFNLSCQWLPITDRVDLIFEMCWWLEVARNHIFPEDFDIIVSYLDTLELYRPPRTHSHQASCSESILSMEESSEIKYQAQLVQDCLRQQHWEIMSQDIAEIRINLGTGWSRHSPELHGETIYVYYICLRLGREVLGET